MYLVINSLMLLLSLLSSCKVAKDTLGKSYDFSSPSKVLVLDASLREISSLSYNVENKTLFTNNDEEGIIKELDIKTGTVVRSYRFGNKGDYEGLSQIGNQIIVTKSSGSLYSFNKETGETTSYKNKLKQENDVEGLCMLTDNLLLLACKGNCLNSKQKSKDSKCVYTYDLALQKLADEPFLNITDKQLSRFIKSKYVGLSKSARKVLQERIQDFAPSGIAIHPITRHIYIISAKGSSIVVIDEDHSINDISFFNSKKIPQPEGITFSPAGRLYVASEGDGFSGRIFIFEPL